MNKIEKIKEQLEGIPTPYDYFSYTREWTTEEINQVMMSEYSELPALAGSLNRSQAAVVAKYLETREDFDNKVVIDALLLDNSGENEGTHDFPFEDYELSAFQKNVSVVHMNINQVIRVNIRLVSEELRASEINTMDKQLSHFMTVPSENGANGGQFGGTRTTAIPDSEYDPDRWGLLNFAPNTTGQIQLGIELKDNKNDELGFKKTILVVVN